MFEVSNTLKKLSFFFNKDAINWSKVTDTFDVKKWLTQYDVKNIIIIIRLLDKLDMFL